MIYLELFLGFLIVGSFSFGGAYSAIPIIKDVVSYFNWLDEDMLAQIIAIGESTPGPIMVNLATYIGMAQGGVFGAVVATTAVVLPAFLIILIVSAIMAKFINNKYVKAVLAGFIPCIIGIIFSTGLWMVIQNSFEAEFKGIEWRSLGIIFGLGILYFGSKKVLKKGMSPVLLIGIAAIVGIVVYMF